MALPGIAVLSDVIRELAILVLIQHENVCIFRNYSNAVEPRNQLPMAWYLWANGHFIQKCCLDVLGLNQFWHGFQPPVGFS